MHRLEITLRDEVLARLDEARGHEPRASFVKRALESALSDTDQEAPASGVADSRGETAPTRAPKKERLSEAQSVKHQADWMLARQRLLNEGKS